MIYILINSTDKQRQFIASSVNVQKDSLKYYKKS